MVDEEHVVSSIQELSGWVLPHGSWRPCPDWWHLTELYDMRDEGYEPFLSLSARMILQEGKEEDIRNLAAEQGFIKISRKMIDGISCTIKQLHTIQQLIDICPEDETFDVVNPRRIQALSKITVEELRALRNPEKLFLKS